MKIINQIGILLLLTVVNQFSWAEEKRGGGINYDFREKLCSDNGIERSYDLAFRKLSSKVRLKNAKWEPGTVFEYWIPIGNGTSSIVWWERKAPGGVCEETFEVLKTGDEIKVFHDGCSGEWKRTEPSANSLGATTWGEMFHASCVRHDHCYHHEPSSNNRDQKFCDEQMRDGNYAICNKQYTPGSSANDECMKAAKRMHQGVSLYNRYYNFMDHRLGYRTLYELK